MLIIFTRSSALSAFVNNIWGGMMFNLARLFVFSEKFPRRFINARVALFSYLIFTRSNEIFV